MEVSEETPLNLTESPIATTENVPISKKRMKKLKKLEEWESKKKLMRIKEREKYKQKRLEAITNGQPTRTGPSRKELKRNKIDQSKCNLTVAIDLSFDELMLDKDISKTIKQLLRVYTINRRSKSPINLYFTGVKDGNRTHEILEKNDGYKNWDVNIQNKTYLDLFDKEKIVYLTSDSDNVLEHLDKDCVYIIGGLVDHNHNKGHCLDQAEKLQIKHARLPLSENIIIKTRTVLTIFHVFDILLRKSEGKSWQDSILEVLPTRKGAKPKQIEIINSTTDNKFNLINTSNTDTDKKVDNLLSLL